MRGEAFLIRYADDFVIGVAREDDARRIMGVLPKRMSKYGLTVHPEKTRLIRFRTARSGERLRPARLRDRPELSHIRLPGIHPLLGPDPIEADEWSSVKTAKGRFKRALQALSAWCRENRHESIESQHQILKQKLQGHYGYYGITGNYFSLQRFLEGSRRIWRRWLSRRRRDGPLRWPDFLRLEQSYPLPRARVVHSLLSHAAKS